jgi:uncharacterized lipoprotein YddW (UPF0748 family)
MRTVTSSIISFFVAILFLNVPLTAQNASPKREFRGVWFASVANIDFPSAPGLSEAQFMGEWSRSLDVFKTAGFNAVVAQMRPAGDAFYNSKIAPRSRYLGGEDATGNFDPMALMIAEAHSRNMEFHAWLNPYRASMDTLVENLPLHHPYRAHPGWFLKYGGKLYFNPALPEVRNYIAEVVMEIVMEYDVDAIHFDDYFYPYPASGETFPDAGDFTKYGYGFYSIEDWRRSNVDKLVSQVSQIIKNVAPDVKFGISPFGVWRNSSADPANGSLTRAGVSTYDDLYANVRGWLEKGWIDYVAPQIYWNIGYPVADYQVLLNWWQRNSFGRQLIAGQAAYKVNKNTEPAWKDPGEIPRQVRLNRSLPEVGGSVFYNASSLLGNPLGVLDSLRNEYFATPALPPEMPYLNLPEPVPPGLGKIKMKKGKVTFDCSLNEDLNNATYLVVYRFEDRLPGDFNNPQNILTTVRIGQEKKVTITDDGAVAGNVYTYAVSAVNRANTESALSNWRAVEVGTKKLKRLK